MMCSAPCFFYLMVVGLTLTVKPLFILPFYLVCLDGWHWVIHLYLWDFRQIEGVFCL